MPQSPDVFLPPAGPNEARREAKRKELEQEFATGFPKALQRIGVPKRLRTARINRVPECIGLMKAWQDFPAKPFGLVGPTGTGKSSAIVTAIRRDLMANEYLDEFMEGRVEFRWVNWVETAQTMKRMARNREWDNPQASLAPLIEWIDNDPGRHILVLDDLGMEEFKEGSTYTNEQIALLIDKAWNIDCRLFWTSNRTPDELADPKKYGERVVSRLLGCAPAEILPDLPDMRVQ